MNLYELLPRDWRNCLGIDEGFFKDIEKAINSQAINPKSENIFKAFMLSPEKVKVVIIGQDPYPNIADAMGLAFSIPASNQNLPGSLRNIKKELQNDLKIELTTSGDLNPWVDQGVLLLNRILTTRSGESLAHSNIGWENFTDLVVAYLSKLPVIFILWGKFAQSLTEKLDSEKIILGVHPSPLSAHRGFFGSKPFSQANAKLASLGLTPIDWKI